MGAQTTELNKELVRRNPAIEAILANSQLAIEYQFGMQCLNQYLTDLSLLAHGANYKDLGIEERRRATYSAIITQIEGRAVLVEDRGLLRNQSLTPENSIAVIRIKGFMKTESSGGSGGVRGARGIAEDLRTAYNNPNISGILLDINSGGGEVTAMDVLIDALSTRNKPVVSHTLFAASAAYGTAAATDEIIALSVITRVGSIGAVISVNKIALQEHSDEILDLYGANAPNKNLEFRSALNGEFGPLQSVVNEATDRFQETVKGLRTLRGSEDRIKDTLSGHTFASIEARKRGLIDGVGGIEYAIKRLQAHIKRAA